PDVDGFVFTGSRAVGMKALETFTRTRPKPIITEMGGKNPAIITANADLEKAVVGVMRAAFGYGGQKCSACSRLLVDQHVKEAFVPILSIVPVEGLEDAIQVANDVDYGLTAGIFSREPAEIRQFFAEVQAGVLYANRTAGATTGAVVGVQPFGGWKMSGISGKSAGGHYYLLQFLREQSQSEYP